MIGRMRAALLIAGCTLAASTLAPRAHAQGEIAWDAPAECPRSDELLARIEELAGMPISATPMRATVVPDGDAFLAQIYCGDGAALREIRASSCDTLTTAVALVLATAMTEVPVPPPEPSEPPEAAPDEELPIDDELDDDLSPPADGALRMVVSASTGAVLGLFGGAEALVGVAVGLRADGFELTAGWSRAFRIEEPDRDTERATVRLGWVMRWDPFELSFRVLGEVYTSFRGLGNDRSGGLWGMVGAGTELRLWIEGVAAVTLEVDGTVPVAPTPVHLGGPRRLEELSSLVGVVSGGILFPIPPPLPTTIEVS